MAEYTVRELILNHEKAFMPASAPGVEAVIQYILTGDQGGDWIIDIHDGMCKVTEGKAPSPKVTITSDAVDFANVLTGKANAMQYFMQGKVKLAGDLNLAMKLTSFFKMSGG